MRTGLSILLALLAVGGVVLLFFNDDTTGQGGGADLDAASGGDGISTGPGRAPMTVERKGGVEVVPAGSWDPELAEADPTPPPPHVVNFELRSEDGEDWKPTGAQVLEILTREFPDLPVRFPDEAALKDFRSRTWPMVVPRVCHLGMVLEMTPEIGFRAITRDGVLYMVRAPEREPPR